MPEHKLSEQEIKQIDIEARDYAWINYDKDKGDWITFKTVYAAALTRERERVKGLEEVLEWTLKIIQPYTPQQIREIKMRMKETLNNYNQNKEA